MFSESFIAAALKSSEHVPASSVQLKDAGIFAHSFQPKSALTKTFKKSSIGPNCLEVNDNYIYVAQAQKAVVHVYNRSNGKHEETAHFNTRIQSLILICSGTVLALGGEDGSIILWELCTGRLMNTPTTHLQAVVVLAVDLKSNFILSGSKDSNIHVWSVTDLLAFGSNSTFSHLRGHAVEPRNTLSGHRDAINTLTTGHSATAIDIAISASQDKTAVIWNYRMGHKLRTILLESTPLCLALAPTDQAFYVGFAEGGIQCVSFYNDDTLWTSISDLESVDTPIKPLCPVINQPDSSSSKSAPTLTNETASPDPESTISIALSYDTSTLITGHSTGKIAAWSTSGTGSFSEILAQYDGLSITNIAFLPPEGWTESKIPDIKLSLIEKPARHEEFSGSKAQLAKSYKIKARLPSAITKLRHNKSIRRLYPTAGRVRFQELLKSQVFPEKILAASAAESAHWNNKDANHQKSQAMSEDFISLNDDLAPNGSKAVADNEKEHMAKEIAELKNKVKHLQKVAITNAKHIDELFSENEMWRRTAYSESEADQHRASDGKISKLGHDTNGIAMRESDHMSVDSSEEEESSEESDSVPMPDKNDASSDRVGVSEKEREDDALYESDDGRTRRRQATPEKYVVLR